MKIFYPHQLAVRRLSMLALVACLGNTSMPAGVSAAAPHTVNIQGILTDSLGVPRMDTVQITFAVYDAFMGGNTLWSEVILIRTGPDGLFTWALGSNIPIPDSVFADTSRWLGIQIDTDPEMTPRRRFTSVPYSFVTGEGGSAGGSFLPLTGGTMTGPITSTGDPSITMGKGSFGRFNTNAGTDAFVTGQSNTAAGDWSTVSGGAFNGALSTGAVVGGGRRNLASGDYAVISGGGGINPSDSNVASGIQSVIGGGKANGAIGNQSTVAGGSLNQATETFATVAGGLNNQATGNSAFIGSGQANTASGTHALVAGGNGNMASGLSASILGGQSNTATGQVVAIGGGQSNSAGGLRTVIGGGVDNITTGIATTVPGGSENEAHGSYSLAAGRRAKANHSGSFVWADSRDSDFVSSSIDQFIVRAHAGVGINTATPQPGYALTVDGDAVQGTRVKVRTQGGVGLDLRASDAGNGSVIMGTDGPYPLNLMTNNQQQIMMDTLGQIGIGAFNLDNRLEVAGATVIGVDFSGSAFVAPANGMIIEGQVGIGSSSPRNMLDVEGAVAVGGDYSGLWLAPDNGLIVQGWAGLGTPTPHSKLHVNGAVATATLTFAGDVSLTEAHSVVLVDASGGDRTVSLPSAIGITGRQYTIKKVDALNFSVTIAPKGAQSIDGATTHTLIGQWRYVTIVSDGADWMIIGNS